MYPFKTVTITVIVIAVIVTVFFLIFMEEGKSVLYTTITILGYSEFDFTSEFYSFMFLPCDFIPFYFSLKNFLFNFL